MASVGSLEVSFLKMSYQGGVLHRIVQNLHFNG